jgi:hypothetical protein
MRIILTALLSMALCACATMPMRTLYNLWNFDPWTSDPGQWRAAVRIPRRAALDPARVQVRLTIETWREGAKDRAKDVFRLVASDAAEDVAPLAGEERQGYQLAAFRLDPAELSRLQALRLRILEERKRPGPRLSGSLTISASACQASSVQDLSGAILLTTYLLVDRKDGYNPLVVDHDIGPELRKAKTGPDLCPAAP